MGHQNLWRRELRLHAVALATFATILAAGQAGAAVTVGGDWGVAPNPLPIGPGDTDIGQSRLYLGSGAPGSFAVDGGSFFGAAVLSLANAGNGTATGIVHGAGSTVLLRGDGDTNRFEVGNWGIGSFTVSGGALLDARADAGACLLGARYCNNFIGNGAGSDGLLTVTGAGSQARFLHAFVVAGASVFRPPTDTFTFGTPGGSTRGTVRVLDGAMLVTEAGTLAQAPGGGSPTGSERTFSDVLIDGPGSVWRVTGGSAADPRAAFVSAANHANAWSVLTIRNGGRLQFDDAPNFVNGINLTTNNGRSDTFVSGAGSGIDVNGGVLQVGRRLGTATMSVDGGATITDAYYVSVGRDGSIGSLTLDGASTALTINRSGPANTTDAGFQGGMQIGRNGTGTVTVTNGARIDVVSTTEGHRARYLTLGAGSASNGTLNISGAGSQVRVSVDSLVPGGGPAETLGPYVGIGQEGAGALNITAGGRLVLDSTVVTTDADRRSSVVNIGGGSDTTVGTRGIAVVRGAGSEISINGGERFIAVGRGPNSFGQLTLADGGKVSATTMNVGRMGAVGVLQMDGGVIELSGQFASPVAALTSTGFGVGIGNGTGVVHMTNGSVISMSNMGTGGTGMTLGGSTNFPTGDGSLTMSGGSSITVSAAPGLGAFTVGRQGAGLLRMSGSSSIDIGDGRFYVARAAGSDGTVIATGGSVIDAGWVGVGRNRLADGSTIDGGTGTMILNGATLNVAGDVVIGTNGFLGGNAGSINVSGSVVNYGIFSPGNSPGVFTINGNFAAGAGGRLILEVASDGAGGFLTDLVQFGGGVDLAGMGVEFRFLGDADPNDFQSAGSFMIDTFLRQTDGQGGWVGIAPAAFDQVTFAARADEWIFTSFSFTADGGAVFNAVPVPEPGTWLLMVAGLAGLAGWQRRRQPCAQSAGAAA